MKIKIIEHKFSVCKVTDYSRVNIEDEFCFIGKTDEERSLVCPTEKVPENVIEHDDGWRALRILGVLDFSLIGILAKISGILSQNGISLFAISTYNTDYILIKADKFDAAVQLLLKNGFSQST